MNELPNKYKPTEVEAKWRQIWLEKDLFRWDPTRPREEAFVVDTPPPTVSGSLHVGHVFSYTHQDLIVRFQRMRGRNIYYPMGWDDNGLPTERRVQNLYNVRCDAHVPYDPNYRPEKTKGAPIVISRRNFIELCHTVTRDDEEVFKALWQSIGLSIQWSEEYATIDARCQTISQRSFLRLLQHGHVYRIEAPMMWDVGFQTAVAQAEVVDKEVPSAYNHMRFDLEEGGHIEIATTRPELLPACVGVVAHPSDKRYQPLFGKRVLTPLFRAPVPILADEAAQPDKGTGVAMVCTFGDATDVEWWKKYNLPLRQVIGLDGKLLHVVFGTEGWESADPETANRHYAELAGVFTKNAQKRIVEQMKENGFLLKDPEPIKHTVRFYEKGDHPLEIIPTSQWFIRILDKKDALIEQGRKIHWHPDHMGIRYERWVEGLNQDWLISRQRYFGVPFPVWFALDENGEILHDKVLTPKLESLPVDPGTDVPPGYEEEQRNQPGGFSAELDVLDTWATSSMTPQLCSMWELDPERHKKLFPMDLRPQAHDIIRTWAFYTIVKAYLHEKEIPWKNVVISGWILDPDRKKMSKSQGNVVTPHHLLEQYSADAVRHWAARARLGVDTAYDEKIFAVGQRLTTKVFNASKFAIMHLVGVDPKQIGPERIVDEIDLAVIDKLREIVAKATESFEQFEYAVALQLVEDFFWKVFCDDYLEISKARIYEEEMTQGRRSTLATLRILLSAQLRMFAPFLPHLTEEIWQWYCAKHEGGLDSIHLNPWPSPDEVEKVGKPQYECSYSVVSQVLEAVRGAKSRASVSMKHVVDRVTVTAGPNEIASLESQIKDIKKILSIESFEFKNREKDGEPLEIAVTLARS